MVKTLSLAGGLAGGYVLGARAGRESTTSSRKRPGDGPANQPGGGVYLTITCDDCDGLFAC